MKLEYFDLLSPNPIYLQQVGGILSPKLKDIAAIGMNTYQHYLTLLSTDLKTYFAMIHQKELAELLTDEENSPINMFDFFTMNNESIQFLQTIFNFFIKEDVAYSPKDKVFYVTRDQQIIGSITRETYQKVCDVICQRNCIQLQKEDLSKVKSKKALDIIKKLQKGRAEKSKHTKSDQNMELGNIISAVANKSQSLNILNIWDLTVYQVWDCFSRLSNNSIFAIQSMSVAAWGNKDNSFDATAWFKRMDNS